jgi:hypothetical protein
MTSKGSSQPRISDGQNATVSQLNTNILRVLPVEQDFPMNRLGQSIGIAGAFAAKSHAIKGV